MNASRLLSGDHAGDCSLSGLSATTAFHHLKEGPVHQEGRAHGSEDWIVGAKVLFRSRLTSVVDGVQDPGLIGSVLAIVRRACELDPEKRYRDAAALAEALRDLRTK